MKRAAFILLSILLLSGCADSTSGSYVDIESEKARQAELVRDLDTYEFTSGKPTELDEKPPGLPALDMARVEFVPSYSPDELVAIEEYRQSRTTTI